jgi:hypothetical protein
MEQTLVARQIRYPAMYQSVWLAGILKLRRTVKSHMDLAQRVANGDEELRILLGEGVTEWQSRRGFEGLILRLKDLDARNFRIRCRRFGRERDPKGERCMGIRYLL